MLTRVSLALLLGLLVTACDSIDLGESEIELARDPVVNQALAAVREASAAYHDPDTAVADGFLATDACVSSPAGTMGFHYFNPGRVMDGAVSVEEPEVLVYHPGPDGPMLGAVEYFFPIVIDGAPWFGDEPPPADKTPAAPILFRRAMNGPMAGHEPGMPWHYDLHAWVWSHNPDGMFADFNPALSCD